MPPASSLVNRPGTVYLDPSSPLYCAFCLEEFETEDDFKWHCQEEAHLAQKRLAGNRAVAVLLNLPEGYCYKCKLCNKKMLTGDVWEEHVKGKQHRNKESLSLLKFKSCSLCNVLFSSASHGRDHFTGKRHRSKVREKGHDPYEDWNDDGHFKIEEPTRRLAGGIGMPSATPSPQQPKLSKPMPLKRLRCGAENAARAAVQTSQPEKNSPLHTKNPAKSPPSPPRAPEPKSTTPRRPARFPRALPSPEFDSFGRLVKPRSPRKTNRKRTGSQLKDGRETVWMALEKAARFSTRGRPRPDLRHLDRPLQERKRKRKTDRRPNESPEPPPKRQRTDELFESYNSSRREPRYNDYTGPTFYEDRDMDVEYF